jgi:adiponectin receptor
MRKDPRIVRIAPTSAMRTVPAWQQLPLTLRGYRVDHDKGAAFVSLFGAHLDTFNIWSHLLGFFYFVAMVPYTMSALRTNGAPALDYAFFLFYIACACSQMLSSSLYHLFRAVEHLDGSLLTLDMWGIVAMILGSWVIGMSQGFYRTPWVGAAYVGAEGVLLAAGRVMGCRAMAGKSSWEAYFVVMGSAVAFGAVPCIHMHSLCGSMACGAATERAIAGMFGNYLIGWLFLVTRFPERVVPGLFDILGHSHQWWHLFVFFAGRAWLLAMLDLNAAARAGADEMSKV